MARNSIIKFITIVFTMSLLSGCSAFKRRASYIPNIYFPKDETDSFFSVYKNDTVGRDHIDEWIFYNTGRFLWKSDQLNMNASNAMDSTTNINLNIFTPISEVKKRFRIEDETMYKDMTVIDRFFVRFAESKGNFATFRFNYEPKEMEYYNSKNKYESWKRVHFVDYNLYDIAFYYPVRPRIIFDKLEFNNGSGVWRDYYFVTSPVEKFVLKEKGRIRDNYKVGKWKYYDKEGNLTHTRRYKKSDKVDVRFPYCIWNEAEPCYCDE